jgi:hypothetical protein
VGSEQWHHARYCVPFVALGLAAGLVGWGRIWNGLELKFGRWTRNAIAGVTWLVMLVFLAGSQLNMNTIMKGIPGRVPDEDVQPIWAEIQKVGPDDGAIAAYELTAPLSSRRLLYSYVMDGNKPKGWPHELPPTIQHLFLRKNFQPEHIWLDQGFKKSWSGRGFEAWHR